MWDRRGWLRADDCSNHGPSTGYPEERRPMPSSLLLPGEWHKYCPEIDHDLFTKIPWNSLFIIAILRELGSVVASSLAISLGGSGFDSRPGGLLRWKISSWFSSFLPGTTFSVRQFKARSLGRHSSLVDQSHGGFFNSKQVFYYTF
jgi:hypothetical protein